jgi:hypothetical protein
MWNPVSEDHARPQHAPACAGEWRVGGGRQTHGAILRAAVKKARARKVTQTSQLDDAGPDIHLFPARAGERRISGCSQSHRAIVRPAIEETRSWDVAEGFQRRDPLVVTHLPEGARKGLGGGGRQADGAVVRAAVQEARPHDVSEALQHDELTHDVRSPARTGEWRVRRRCQPD